jgi:urease accessory protein UreH
MEYDKSSLRFLIETCRRNEFSAKQTHEFINTAWPEAVSLRRVQQIHAELEAGKEKKEDARGRPRSSRTDENISRVDACVVENPCCCIEFIAEETGIPWTTVRRILVEDLGLEWRIARWLPHKLTDDQKTARVTLCKEMLQTLKKRGSMARTVVIDEKIVYHDPVNNKEINAAWISPNDDQPVVYRRTQFSPKTMVVAAMSFTGKVHVKLVKKGETINSDAYITFLREVFHNFSRHKEPLHTDNILLIHDNARVHTSTAVREFLLSRGVTVLHQPPYSPDTNALDRFAFRAVEEKRHRRTFSTAVEVENHVTDVLKCFSSERLQHEFSELVDDLQSIMNCGGEYL